MLDKNDLKQIRQEIHEEVGEIIEQNNKKIRLEMGEVLEQNILPAINDLREDVDGLKKEVGSLKKGFVGLKEEVHELRTDVNEMRAEMVTKEYLDVKLSDLRGDLVVLVRKEDGKLAKLVEILKGKNVLVDKDVQEIFQLEPFAKSA